MKTILGLAIALMLGGTGAYAQGGPPEKMHGPGAAHEHGAGERGMRGGGPGPQMQRVQPQSEHHGERGPSIAKGQRDGGRHAERQSEETRSPKNAASEQANRVKSTEKGERGDRGTKKPDARAEERSRSNRERSFQATNEGKGRNEREHIRAYRDTTERAGQRSTQTATGERKEDAKRVALSDEKRDRVRTAFHERADLKHRTNVNINLRVGTRLPHDWDFVPVPVAVVDIVTEYGGYLFAYVDDDYVICDPETYEIVVIIPASGGPSYASDEFGGRCTEHIHLNEDERDLIVHATRHDEEVDVAAPDDRLECAGEHRAAKVPRPHPFARR